MKRFLTATLLSIVIAGPFMESAAQAYWIWSPDLGKWTNPKKSAKDSPDEQFNWAMEFYNQKNWDRAIEEFEKLPAAYPNSRLAAEGVYHIGLSWEEKEDLAKAADAYQRLIDRYPYSDRIKDAIKREFDIANEFASGTKVKVWGIPALSGQEKALELYRHIVKNAPYGSYGDQAQFNIGEVYKKQTEFQEAQKAFQAVVDDYPTSELITKAKYQIAECSMAASKQAQYSEQYAQRAIEEFEGFKQAYPGGQEAVAADESIRVLRAKKAETNFNVGEFYEKRKKYSSAKVYYQEVVNNYPETLSAVEAKKRLENIASDESKPQGKGFKLRLW